MEARPGPRAGQTGRRGGLFMLSPARESESDGESPSHRDALTVCVHVTPHDHSRVSMRECLRVSAN